MKNLNKTEMLELLAKQCFEQKIELEYDGEEKTVDDYFKMLSVCDEVSTELEYLKAGVIDDVHISIVEKTQYYSDNDEIFLVIEFVKTDSNGSKGYLQFKGRYSSWDASAYYEVAEVFPRTRTTVEYVTKAKLKD